MLQQRDPKCICMLLAGGQGSRLMALTEQQAKPAVTIGGRYRIIDFSLSNCAHSGIRTVGVLTQYQPYDLHCHIGNGGAWQMYNDNRGNGIHILPPFSNQEGGAFYSGTANAIYQNMPFLESLGPDYVLILSGDHVYKMDYNKMLQNHIKTGADCTIAVFEVALSEASRFGIMSATPSGRITQFEEKPKIPRSNLASMGVYIFSWRQMQKYLNADCLDASSDHDFGKNIIPRMLKDGRRMQAYPFRGYWRDVGTLEAFWQVNMDMLRDIDLGTPEWEVFSRHIGNLPPTYYGPNASVTNSLVSEGCQVYGWVENSVLSPGVVVEEGAHVVDSVVMQGAVIKRDARVHYSILDEGSLVYDNAIIGVPRKKGGEISVVAKNVIVGRGLELQQTSLALKDLA